MLTPLKVVPPRWRLWLARIGAGDYLEVGQTFRQYFVELGGLKPSDAVLEVGCGLGRMAVGLTGFLNGRYEGFDVSPSNVRWCTRQITARKPSFRFKSVPVHNTLYNPRGTIQPGRFLFPYATAEFDFIIAASVFTHMGPEGVAQYLKECARVLKPDGVCFATFFLLRGEIPKGAQESFPHDYVTHRLNRLDKPDALVAYQEPFGRSLFMTAGLSVRDPVVRGKWTGEPEYLSYQDLVVARAKVL